MPERPSRRRTPGGREDRPAVRAGRRAVTRTLVAACAAVALLAAVDAWANAGRIHAGVEIGGVPVGGLTVGEAEGKIEDRSSGVLDGVELDGAPLPLHVAPEEMGLTYNTSEAARDAYGLGRRGHVVRRIADRAKGYLGGVSVSPRADYDRGAATALTEGFAARVQAAPRDAALVLKDGAARVSEARRGYELDEAATAESLRRAVESMSGEANVAGRTLEPGTVDGEAQEALRRFERATAGPVVVEEDRQLWRIPPPQLARALVAAPEEGSIGLRLDRARLRGHLAGMFRELNAEPVEAGFEVEDGEVVVTPGREGKRVDEDRLFDAIQAGVFEGVREYEVRVETVSPGLTTAEAEKEKPEKLLGSYRTDYSVVPDDGTRVENLGISSEAVNGTLLEPGDTFSMLEHVAGLDYNESKVIVGGVETSADGGGLCQVTSTLYNAANFAGLDVVERTPHSAQLPYIRPGMDATVWWGGPGGGDDLDMKFRNTTEGYLLLREFVAEDGYVYAEIWGQPDGTEVEMSSVPTRMGSDGSRWVTYQTVKQGGEVVYDGVLHRDSYAPLVDERGRTIPPEEVPVAPVDP